MPEVSHLVNTQVNYTMAMKRTFSNLVAMNLIFFEAKVLTTEEVSSSASSVQTMFAHVLNGMLNS